MNSGFHNDLDTNFEQACKMSEMQFSHAELIGMLTDGNIPQKQIAALKLDCIQNESEAKILMSNLTGCDGKIREAVALKIQEIISSENSKYFCSKEFAKIFADATIDINANICRLVINSVEALIADKDFFEVYSERILLFIQEAFDGLDKIIYKDKKYTVNKQLFKLYWCLEGLKIFAKQIDINTLRPILTRACEETEYTIREKVAQIVRLLQSKELISIKKCLENDENYYVREALSSLNHFCTFQNV